MIRCILLNQDGTIVRGGNELLSQWSPGSNQKCWIDINDGDVEDEQQFLLDLHCHPLAIKDSLRKRHPPKIEFFAEQVFMLYSGIFKTQDDLAFEHTQISLFASRDLLITRHSRPSFAVNFWWDCEELLTTFRSPLLLATRIMHTSFGVYLDALLEFEQDLTENEDAMQESPDDELMREIIQHRARLRRLLRTFNYHKKLTGELLEHVHNQNITTETDISHDVQDLHERADRISSLLDMYYGICGDLVEGYISITSHNLNKTMQILTVVTTLFVPLGFLAGLYGMNFDHIPELHFPNAYFILLGIMFMIAISTLTIFRKKRWI